MLKIEKLTKTFHKGTINEKQAIRGVSLHLAPGISSPSSGATGRGSPPSST